MTLNLKWKLRKIDIATICTTIRKTGVNIEGYEGAGEGEGDLRNLDLSRDFHVLQVHEAGKYVLRSVP